MLRGLAEDGPLNANPPIFFSPIIWEFYLQRVQLFWESELQKKIPWGDLGVGTDININIKKLEKKSKI
jgi:hypothetical protein